MKRVVNLIGPLCKDLSGIDTSLPTILIDGAATFKPCFERSLSVGDGDSLGNLEASLLDFTYPCEKDETDLLLALKHLEKIFEFDFIHAYGLMGGQIDHQLAVFFEFLAFLKRFEQKQVHLIHPNQKTILYAPGSYQFSHQGRFSLFTTEKGDFSLKGAVKYPIGEKNAFKLPLSGLGISNEATGLISIKSPIPFLFFSF